MALEKIIKIKESQGFIIHTKDGRTLKEDSKDWKEVVKETNNLKDVSSLQLRDDKGKFYTVSVNGAKADFIQLKRNVMDIMAGTNELVERVVGCVLKDDNNQPLFAVKMVINEKNKNVLLTVEKKTEKGWIKL